MIATVMVWSGCALMHMNTQDEDVPLIKPWMQHSRTLQRGAVRSAKWSATILYHQTPYTS